MKEHHFRGGVEYVTEQCCNCGVMFAMTSDTQRRRLADRKSFYCPNGHSQHYIGKTETEKLREKLERKEQEAAEARWEAEDEARKYKRLRKRVMSGTCPCCDEAFPNLTAHIRESHADELGADEFLRHLRHSLGLTQADLGNEIDVLPAYLSNAENGRHVPEWARERIEEWVRKVGA